jgi:8-oxo-dGTP pyrophosphatase MutT (NUDIX family)
VSEALPTGGERRDAWRSEPKVAAWELSLREAGCTLDHLELLRGLHKRDGSLLFALVKATGLDPEGRPLLPYALLRGPACVVVPVITVAETGEEQFLMVRQRRMGHGRMALEFPAGMLDRDLHDPLGVAQRELLEETGLEALAEKFFLLHPHALYSSPGLSDESVWFYGCRLTLPRQACEALHGGTAGEAHEGEHIEVVMMNRDVVQQQTDSLQTLLALHLYEAWRATGGSQNQRLMPR